MSLSDVQTESPPDTNAPGLDIAGWNEAFQYVARHYGVPFSPGAAKQLIETLHNNGTEECLTRMAGKMGLRIKRAAPTSNLLTSWRLPTILQFADGAVGVVTALSANQEVSVVFSGDGGCATTLPLDIVLSHSDFAVVARPQRGTVDERVDSYIAPHREH